MKRLLLIFGFLQVLIAVPVIFFLLIELNSLYLNLDLDATRFIIGYLYFCALFIHGLIQIIRALFFKNSSEKISKYLFFIGIGLLFLLIPIIIGFVIYPIYQLLDTVGV